MGMFFRYASRCVDVGLKRPDKSTEGVGSAALAETVQAGLYFGVFGGSGLELGQQFAPKLGGFSRIRRSRRIQPQEPQRLRIVGLESKHVA
jgi:hypothetical protein